MGIGILVLLLLVLGIGAVLKSPVNGHSQGAQQPQAPAGSSVEKNIDLEGSSSIGGQSASAENSPAGAAQNVTPPPISSTPPQALPAQAPSGQQRVELQG
ncbi:SPOR domain-containing protein, partial [Erwinia amylovora]|nr:SPOR domain-containing protein [Erwinia amylovora]